MQKFRRPGQSIPLLALLMVFIIAMVGLSVDVGNAYGQQRRMQNAANAGAYGAMNAWIASQSNMGNWTNAKIWQNATRALSANRIELNSPKYTYRVDYIMRNGSVTRLAEWTGTVQNPATISGTPPNDIGRIEVSVSNKVETFFARIAYKNDFTVHGAADVCFGGFSLAIMPVGMPAMFKPFDTESGFLGSAATSRVAQAATTDNNDLSYQVAVTQQGQTSFVSSRTFSAAKPTDTPTATPPSATDTPTPTPTDKVPPGQAAKTPTPTATPTTVPGSTATPTTVPGSTATPTTGPGATATSGPPATATPTPLPPRMDRLFEGWTDANGNGKPDPNEVAINEITDYSDPRWTAFTPGGDPSLLEGHIIFLPLENKFHGEPGSHIPWLDWRQSGVNFRDRLTWPGTLPSGYQEAKDPTAAEGADHDGIPEPGDYIKAETGVVAGQADEIVNWDYRDVLLPIIDHDNGRNGANLGFHWYITGKFRAVGYFYANGADKNYGLQRPAGVDSNEKYVMLEYIGPADSGTAQACNP